MDQSHERGISPLPDEWCLLGDELRHFFARSSTPDTHSPEDLVQATMLRAVRRFTKIPLADAVARRAYVWQVARSVLCDALRRWKRQRGGHLRYVGSLEDLASLERESHGMAGNTNTDSGFDGVEVRQRLQHELRLGGLDSIAAVLLVLTRYDGRSVADARTELGMTARQAEAARRRGLRFLSAHGRIKRLCLGLGCLPQWFQTPDSRLQTPD